MQYSIQTMVFLNLIMIFASGCDMYAQSWVQRFSFDMKQSGEITSSNQEVSRMVEAKVVRTFSQLLCSFNAQRPHKQNIIFLLQVRNSHTKRWGTWHHAYTWGVDTQLSHQSPSDGHSTYEYVRLEVPLENADAFRVKIVGKQASDIEKVDFVHVTTISKSLFSSDLDTRNYQSFRNMHIEGVPYLSQFALDHEHKAKMCSPTSVVMVCSALDSSQRNVLEAASDIFDHGLGVYGSWPFNTNYMYQALKRKYKVYPTRLQNITELYTQLCKSLPVIVSVRGNIQGAPRPYPHGHLLVVTGYDARTRQIICNDPAADGATGMQRYNIEDFIVAWERSLRLTYFLEAI